MYYVAEYTVGAT